VTDIDLSLLPDSGVDRARDFIEKQLAWLDDTPGARRDREAQQYPQFTVFPDSPNRERLRDDVQTWQEVAGQMVLDAPHDTTVVVDPPRQQPNIPARVLSFRAHARTSDPDTSHAAADTVIDPNKGTYRRIISLIRLRRDGLSDEQLFDLWSEARDADYPPISPSGLRSRRSELTRHGLIVPGGEGRTRAGRRCTLWRLP
jgi:hypothetical protein